MDNSEDSISHRRTVVTQFVKSLETLNKSESTVSNDRNEGLRSSLMRRSVAMLSTPSTPVPLRTIGRTPALGTAQKVCRNDLETNENYDEDEPSTFDFAVTEYFDYLERGANMLEENRLIGIKLPRQIKVF